VHVHDNIISRIYELCAQIHTLVIFKTVQKLGNSKTILLLCDTHWTHTAYMYMYMYVLNTCYTYHSTTIVLYIITSFL